jgi:hypothetical protein
MSNRKDERPLSRPPAGPKKLMEWKSPPKYKPGCGILLLTDLEPTHLLNKAFNKTPNFIQVPEATVSPLRPKHCRRACRQSQHRPFRSCWFIKGELIPAPHDMTLIFEKLDMPSLFIRETRNCRSLPLCRPNHFWRIQRKEQFAVASMVVIPWKSDDNNDTGNNVARWEAGT